MPVGLSWVDPSAGGALDLAVGNVISEGWMDSIASDLLVLGGGGGSLHTGNYQMTGFVGIGPAAAPSSINGLTVAASGLTGATQTGIFANVSGTGNAEIAGVTAYAYPAAGIAVTQVSQFHALNPARGAGATITQEMGVLVESITQGTNSNYGVFVATPSGGSGNNFGIYVAGGSPAIYVQSGGLTVTAGISQLVGNIQAGPPGAGYSATGAIRMASTQSICWRNSGNSGDIVFGPDGADRLVFSGGIATTNTVGAAGGAAAMPTPAAYWQLNINGTNFKVALLNP